MVMVFSVAPRMLLEFLAKTLPFSDLASAELEKLARHCLINFYPKGSIILHQSITEVNHLCLIQKGGVKVYFQADGYEGNAQGFRRRGGCNWCVEYREGRTGPT